VRGEPPSNPTKIVQASILATQAAPGDRTAATADRACGSGSACRPGQGADGQDEEVRMAPQGALLTDMRVDDFDFDLPQERIALRPARPRDSAKLLHVPGREGPFGDLKVSDLPRCARATCWCSTTHA
jgi:hypothetical protein